MQINLKKTASTLIEVILVMTIMGVIAAMTVPGLQKHSQRIERAQMVKKAYFTLDGAMTSTIANRSFDTDSWMPSTTPPLMADVFRPYLNVIKDCTVGAPLNPKDPTGPKSYSISAGCFGEDLGKTYANIYKFENQEVVELGKDGKGCASMVLADGIAFLAKGSEIWVDVNATAPPNKEGVDVFVFKVVKADSLCVASEKGEHRICPGNEHTRSLMDEGWKIKYW